MEYKLGKEDFERHLETQIGFLKNSVSMFDSGSLDECLRMAVVARVLVYDTKRQTSVLTHLDRKDVPFFDTAFPYDSKSRSSHSGLTLLRVGGKSPGRFAPLDEGLHSGQSDFDAWWNGVVFVDQSRRQFSRKDLVLTLAHKEGGAHVDSAIDQAYADLRRNNSLGWIRVDKRGIESPAEDEVPFAMRQITHELIKTLEPTYTCRKEFPNDGGFTAGGFGIHTGVSAPSERPDINPKKKPKPAAHPTTKIGRNDQCPCGSGVKHKRCCGKAY